MKRVFYLLILGYALINLNFLCPIYSVPLEGYSDIPTGPITLQELHDFNPENIKDLKGNGMPTMHFRRMHFYVKHQFDSVYCYVDYLHNKFPEKTAHFLDSMSSELQIGDSIMLILLYDKINPSNGEHFSYYMSYESVQKYTVKTIGFHIKKLRQSMNF